MRLSMPELPEVETIVRDLCECIVGLRVKAISELRKGTVINSNDIAVERLGVVKSVERRGKYIFIVFDGESLISIHLRMTGKLIFAPFSDELSKYARCFIDFEEGGRLLFDDVRAFGKLEIIDAPGRQKIEAKLGVEPLSNSFDFEYLKRALYKKRTNLKNFLLDQKVIAGLGNIYVNEILFRSKLNPVRITTSLEETEIYILLTEIKEVLKLAIECNGTSISDYRRVDDKKGSFQNFLKIYGKSVCDKGHNVEKIRQNGRSTYFCPICQANSHYTR